MVGKGFKDIECHKMEKHIDGQRRMSYNCEGGHGPTWTVVPQMMMMMMMILSLLDSLAEFLQKFNSVALNLLISILFIAL